MYRALMFCSCLLFAQFAYSAIYQWVDHQGNTHYSQHPPADKSISTQNITVTKKPVADAKKNQQSIQDSANEIAKSNAERQAARDKLQQQAEENKRLQESCEASKKSLIELDYGGNRLYKDTEGNYSRFTDEDKNNQREQLNDFINKNCR
ncbi:MAG: hypothetical protein ACJA2Y_000718 [Cycloclasticus pugetii]|jgi:hypothetical protein|uniref:DUF4124 domain-containing protein n=2 Tax=Cycloclasticus pugetii TaxID=34068 RepID=UPI0039E48B00